MADGLYFELRTPHDTVFAGSLLSARVETESGAVGLRPRGEPMVLVVEPGLVLLHAADALTIGATVGGLLESERDHCTLYTPFAIVGTEEHVRAELEHVLATPGVELAARRQLADLERHLLEQLGSGTARIHARGRR